MSESAVRKRSIGQFLAAAGVVISLLFVGYEIRQNTTLARAQMRNELSMGIVNWLMVEAENPQLASVALRGRVGGELTVEEARQYERQTRALFRCWENVHYQYRQGLYDEVEFSGHRDAMREEVTTWPGVGNPLVPNEGNVLARVQGRDGWLPV